MGTWFHDQAGTGFLRNSHEIHGRTRKNKGIFSNVFVFFRVFRGHIILLY